MNISLPCEGHGWQVDLDQDNGVDCNFSCSRTTANKDNCEDYLKLNDYCLKDFCNELITESCQLKFKNKSGYFACVQNASLKESLLPFHPSPNQIDSFIVAFAEPKREYIQYSLA